MSEEFKKIAVIGGGISGLSLAFRLRTLAQQQQKQITVDIFEHRSKMGGLIQTDHDQEFVIEKGPDGFLQTKPTLRNLSRELGIEHELITTKKTNRRSMILQNGRLVEVPDGFYLMSPSKIFPFLKSPLLSWRGKLRTLSEYFIPRKKTPDDESLADFVRRRFGSENLEKISQAMLGGIYTADPSQLSMNCALPRFVEMEKKYGSVMKGIMSTMKSRDDVSGARYGLFGSYRHGMNTLINAIVQKLDPSSVHMNCEIASIESKNSSWNISVNHENKSYDVVCLAMAPQQIANVFLNLSETEKQMLNSIPFASSAIYNLGFRSSQIKNKPNAVGFIVPQTEKKHFIACSFMSDKYENRAPHDHSLIRVFVGGALQENVFKLPEDQLRSTIKKELSTLLKIEGEPILEDWIMWKESMPQYTLGHEQRLNQIQLSFKKFPNLYVVGNAYRGVGIPDLVEHANQVADQIIDQLK